MLVAVWLLCKVSHEDNEEHIIRNSFNNTFAGRHRCETSLETGCKNSGPFASAVIKTGATKRGSGNSYAATLTVFEFFLVNPRSNLASKRVAMSACRVFSFVKTVLANKPCWLIMATGAEFQTATFCLFCKTACTWSSTRVMRRSTLTTKFSTTVANAAVS